MCANKFILIFHFFVLVSSDHKHRSRKGRLFSFNTIDDDIHIDLDFTVPFISIPVKKTVDTAFGIPGLTASGLPTININPASLALAGAVVLGTTVLVPLFLKNYAYHHPEDRSSRLIGAADFEMDEVLEFASKMVTEGGNMRGCALRVACWTGRMPTPDAAKIWNHVLSNRLLTSMVNATAVEDAMLSGSQGRDCDTYTPCPIRDHHVPALMRNIALIAGRL